MQLNAALVHVRHFIKKNILPKILPTPNFRSGCVFTLTRTRVWS